MKHLHSLIHIFLTVSFLFFFGFLFSQEKSGSKVYQPELGQEGKDVRWFPTPQELVDKMLDMAKITPSDFLVDLGSGDGCIVITAAKRGTRGVGIEYNPDLVELSKMNAIKAGVKDIVEFLKTDLFNYDFSKATVLTLFLLPEINLRLRPRILDMKPGTRVVSTTFTMQNWQHDDMVMIDDPNSKWTTAYLWIVPAKIYGTWKFKGGELKLVQKFQMVTGKITSAGKSVEISNGRLKGNNFTFKAGSTIYTCEVTGKSMKGTSESEGKTSSWTAQKLN
jgi:Histone methylation protein DOT1